MQIGVPPLFAMVVAGHTENSAPLQASLGFARTFYAIVALMPLQAMCAYFNAVVPGCIGAGRTDRLPRYFWRSMLYSCALSMPMIESMAAVAVSAMLLASCMRTLACSGKK